MRRFGQNPLTMRWRIQPLFGVAVLTAIAVVTIAVFTALLLWELRAKDVAHATGETVSLSHILAEQATRSIQNVDLIVQGTEVRLAGLAAKGDPLNGRHVHELLRSRLSGVPHVRSLFVVDAKGMSVNGSRQFPSTGLSLTDREYFTVHRDHPRRGLYVGAPTRARTDGTWTLHLSRRIAGPNGEFRGVIVAALDLGYFETLYESIKFDGIAPIALFLDNGTLVAMQPRDESSIGQRMVDASQAWFSRTDELTRAETLPRGERRIVTYHKVAYFPLVVAVGIGMDVILAGWWETARLILIGSFGVIVLLVFAAGALAMEVTKEELLTRDLSESGERLQATIKSAMDAVVIVDADQRVILFNPAAERMFGCTAAEAVGAPLEHFLPQRYRAAHRAHVENFGASGIRSREMAAQMDIVGLRADGQEFPIESTVSQVKLNGETLYTAILRDVTERRQAEEQLRESNRQLRQLSGSLQNIREEERSRIARELHDELGQQLTGLKMDLAWVANQMRGERSDLAAKVSGMEQHVNATIKSMRRISTELRPALLDDLGLGAAIEWLTADFSRRTGVAVALDLAAADCAQGDAMVTALFRITQECLTNVARHAQATQVRISLLQVGPNLELTVNDDGKGMVTPVAVSSEGLGLIGIRERAIMLNGAATFSSRADAGTTIKIVVPMSNC